jgi:hypothetical protein
MNSTYSKLVEEKIITLQEAIIFTEYKQKISEASCFIFDKCFEAYVELYGIPPVKKKQKSKRGYYTSLAYFDKLSLMYICYEYYNVNQTYIANKLNVDRTTISILSSKTRYIVKNNLKDEFSQAQIKRLNLWLVFAEQALAEYAEKASYLPLTD